MVGGMPGGRPFWAAVRAFAANMVALLSLDTLNYEPVEMMFRWPAAIVASLFVATVVYAGAKLDELKEHQQ